MRRTLAIPHQSNGKNHASDRQHTMPVSLTRLGRLILCSLLLTACSDPLPTAVLVELLPKLTVTTTTPQVEEGKPAKFVIHLSEPSAQPVTVRYYTQAGTASSSDDPPDYDGQDTPFNPSERTFNPGQTELVVEINTTNDVVYEADETFRFYLHSGVGADVDLSQYYAEVTILNDDDPPTLDFAADVPPSRTVLENAGRVSLAFVLDNSNNTPGVDITVPIQYSGDAVPGEDFRGPEQITLPKGQTLKDFEFTLDLIDDIQSDEADKDIVVTLGTPDNALLGTYTQLTITLRDDDGNGTLNDTGIDQCQDDTDVSPCPVTTHPGQDGEQNTPMRFSLYAVGDDECIVDETTGLMWERKQDDTLTTGKRRAIATYTWYETSVNINGGEAGTNSPASTATSGACGLDNCTTTAYAQHLNDSALCGFTDWRLPKLHELLGLMRFDLPCLESDASGTCVRQAAIDPVAFPRTVDYWYWSASPSAYRSAYAWAVDFATGTYTTRLKSEAFHLRGVRRIRAGDLPP